MTFSIVVPTYNEEKDIKETLDSLIALEHSEREIIVVDDSNDSTPTIVGGYADRGVRLIRPERRRGRCEARNVGILAARGDVVVILNADVRLPSDFLKRVAVHYENGCDYVLVRSRALNTEALFARYVDAAACADHEGDPSWMEWTEGFSCRREMAIRAGLFPTGFPVPICAGEDGFFGTNLRRLGARKKIDFDIVIGHVAPAGLAEYWQVRKGRGRGSAQVRRFLEGWSMARIAAWALLRVFKNLCLTVLVVPVLLIAGRAARHSMSGSQDVVSFAMAWLIEQAAFHVGEWESIFQILRAERRMRTCNA